MRAFEGEGDELWPTRHQIDIDALRAGSDPDAFMTDAVELFKEVASVATLVAATDTEDRDYERDEAIRRALLVRLAKLANSLLNETCAGHGEQQFVMARQVLETAINLLYLLRVGNERYEDFVYDSLYAERELAALIRANIEGRGGTSLPIEERMLRSIIATADAAGVELEAVPSRNNINWPSVYDRMRALGLVDLYVLFRLGSNAVHGGWSELYLHHLTDAGPGRFRPYFEHLTPRPEPLSACGIVTLVALNEYLDDPDSARGELFGPRFDDLRDRLIQFEQVHEEFLERGQ